MQLSDDQNKAVETILDWYKSSKTGGYITLGGYAGTGKTTLINHIQKILHKEYKNLKICFCSYTGKASRVLQEKIEYGEYNQNDTISTIHSLMYEPIKNSKDEIISWTRRNTLKCDLIVVDEASMIDQYIWNDLVSYQIPILAVGDHGQLPPISGSLNLMNEPIIRLEQIHRQALDNPIISLSDHIRRSGEIPDSLISGSVMKLKKGSDESREVISELLESYSNDMMILCGFNATRIKLNKFMRQIKERDPFMPERNDRVICLKNNHDKEIYNGMIGTIRSIEDNEDDWYFASIEMDGKNELYKGLIYKNQFNANNSSIPSNVYAQGDLFDYGYALTVHKAQGSQARRVILFAEKSQYMTDDTWRRWLYTGVTRAEEELYIVI